MRLLGATTPGIMRGVIQLDMYFAAIVEMRTLSPLLIPRFCASIGLIHDWRQAAFSAIVRKWNAHALYSGNRRNCSGNLSVSGSL